MAIVYDKMLYFYPVKEYNKELAVSCFFSDSTSMGHSTIRTNKHLKCF